ncbi:MAG: hypothetical protein ACLPWF_32720 [Bryobacteraceae bacterium]
MRFSGAWFAAHYAESVPDVIAGKRIQQSLLVSARYFGGTASTYLKTLDGKVSCEEDRIIAREGLRLQYPIH